MWGEHWMLVPGTDIYEGKRAVFRELGLFVLDASYLQSRLVKSVSVRNWSLSRGLGEGLAG